MFLKTLYFIIPLIHQKYRSHRKNTPAIQILKLIIRVYLYIKRAHCSTQIDLNSYLFLVHSFNHALFIKIIFVILSNYCQCIEHTHVDIWFGWLRFDWMVGCDKPEKEKVINAFDEKIEQQFDIWYILRTMLTVRFFQN